MREECIHFQSRTYASGEAARFCVLDLAPEAPWRCPDNCPSYHRRMADVGWVHGSLVEPALEDEPGAGGPDVAEMLGLRRGHRQRGRPGRARGGAGRGRPAGAFGRPLVAPEALTSEQSGPVRLIRARPQRPVNFGVRFSMNAVTASVRSSEASIPAFHVAT